MNGKTSKPNYVYFIRKKKHMKIQCYELIIVKKGYQIKGEKCALVFEADK